MSEMLKDLMEKTHETAKINLKTYGYLENVMIAMTDRGPFVNTLEWTTEEEKIKTLDHCVKAMSQMSCQLYVMVGEAWATKIQLENLYGDSLEEILQLKGKEGFDCILTTGATRYKVNLAIMTPYSSQNNEIKFGNSIRFDPTNNFHSWIHNSMFKGIF